MGKSGEVTDGEGSRVGLVLRATEQTWVLDPKSRRGFLSRPDSPVHRYLWLFLGWGWLCGLKVRIKTLGWPYKRGETKQDGGCSCVHAIF